MSSSNYAPLQAHDEEHSGGIVSDETPRLPSLEFDRPAPLNSSESALGLLENAEHVDREEQAQSPRSTPPPPLSRLSQTTLIDQPVVASPTETRENSPTRRPSAPSPRSDTPTPRHTFTRTFTGWSTGSSKTFWSKRSLSDFKDSIRYSLTPEQHVPLERIQTTNHSLTARIYSYWHQSRRLWRLAAAEWLMTALLCTFYGVVMYTYQRVGYLTDGHKVMFNCLTSALSFILGVNLAGSLRSYAKLLRWLLLSMAYRPLETFDLVLGCDNLANVVELLWKARRETEDKQSKWRFLPCTTQILCVLWLLANICAMLAVTCISLTYNMDPGNQYDYSTGAAYVTDFGALWLDSDYYQTITAVQTWGEAAFSVRESYGLGFNDQHAASYTTTLNGTTQLWLHIWNPNDESFYNYLSDRRIRSTAVCNGYRVTQGEYGNQTLAVYAVEGGADMNFTIPEDAKPGPGGILASSAPNSTCGPRCTNVNVFVARTDPALNVVPVSTDDTGVQPHRVDEAMYFICNNTLSEVIWDNGLRTERAADIYQFDDRVAQVLAGAVGWPDHPPEGAAATQHQEYLYMAYEDGSNVVNGFHDRYPPVPTVANVSNFVSSFTMRAMALLDDWYFGSPNYLELENTQTPVLGLKLTVDWRNALWMLAAIPGMQFICLVLVFVFANRAIIKDDSHLSMAKLYLSLLQNHGFDKKGCMLKREAIVERMGNPKVAYAWVEGVQDDGTNRGKTICHLDVFRKEDGVDCTRDFEDKRFFDGFGEEGMRSTPRPQPAVRRDFDATLYF